MSKVRQRKRKRKAKGKRKPAHKTPYDQYINSKAWQNKRREAINASGGKCQGCGTDRSLTVHHKTYARLGKEKLTDLVVLCQDCHADEHLAKVFGVSTESLQDFLTRPA